MKKVIKYISALLLLVIVYLGYSNYQKLVIISGLSAKWVASGVFVAERTQNSIENTDSNFSPVTWATNKVSFEEKSVTTKVFGLKERVAVFREGLGAVVVDGDFNADEPYLTPKRNRTNSNLPFPYGDLPQKDTVFSNIDYEELQTTVDTYFQQDNEQNQTRSLLIVYKNQIIAEKYSDGFDEKTPFLGWSMAKSVLSAVYGVLDYQGKIDIHAPFSVDTWKNDERSKITINNLLQMNSGLEWEEDYTKISDATKMLYLENDMTKSQEHKKLIGKPNESWNYSSGTTNLLSGILRQKFKSHQQYLDFWYNDFIDKIGMYSMLLEVDLAGNYVASSYAWANTRDWAKFGLLYLNNGHWNGEQIISKDWVKYTASPTNTSEGIYGAQFWLNSKGHLPDVPKDMFMASGYQGQHVFIIPSKELVVVRMGVNYNNTKALLKERGFNKEENKQVVEFELKNEKNNQLLKKIIAIIQ